MGVRKSSPELSKNSSSFFQHFSIPVDLHPDTPATPAREKKHGPEMVPGSSPELGATWSLVPLSAGFLLGSQAFVKCTHAIHAFLQCFSRISSGFARYCCGCPGAPCCCLGFWNFEEKRSTRFTGFCKMYSCHSCLSPVFFPDFLRLC